MPFPGMLTGETTVSAPSGTPADGKAIVATSAAVNGVVPTEWRSLSVDLSGYQPLDADLTALAALGYTSGSLLAKKTAANTYSLIALSAAGEALLDDADAEAQRTTMGAIGGSLGSTDNRILRSDGTGGATAQGSAVTIDDSGNVSGVAGLTMAGDLLFTDATYDIGKSGATRPRDGYFSRNVTAGSVLYADQVQATGNNAIVVLANRPGSGGSGNFGWYTSNSILRCYSYAAGADRLTIDSSGNLTASGRVLASSGTRFLPTYSFSSQSATGMFINISPFYLGFSVAETETLKLSTTEATITGNLTASGTVTVGASTFAALPSASANTGAILRVTDRGQKLVHSDGTDWRFVHDNTIAS